MNPLESFLFLLAGYLLGSISFAVLIARSRGVDIFSRGSGNAGATNVKRVLGNQAGNLCFLLDVGKGALAAILPWLLGFEDSQLLGVIGLFGALLGHSFSVFIRFRGGKGVAVTIGGLLVLMTWPLLIGIVVWLATYFRTRYVSLASILLGVSLPISALLLGYESLLLYFSLLVALIIVVRHRSNIVRLLQGRENRFASSRGSSSNKKYSTVDG